MISNHKLKLRSLLVGLAALSAIVVPPSFPSTTGVTQVTFTGQPLSAVFGQSVASAGDVNGDGYDDVIVGAQYNGEGRAYIFFGGTAIDTIPDVVLTYRITNDRFGYSVAGAGDMNGDGYADVIVGAYQSGPLGLDSGHVYIYFGGVSMDTVPDVTLGGGPADSFGKSVACAGDVNGDGYSDVIIGANGNDANGLDCGRAYILFGGATVDNIPDVIISGTVLVEDLGNSVAGAGDVNNDGYDDVIVGAFANDLVGGNNGGRAYLYLGGSPMNNVVDVTFSGIGSFDYFGTCVAGAGDVNNDGYDDILISAQTSPAQQGRVSLYFGGAAMNNVPDLTLRGEGTTNLFGWSLAGAGDINGDGFSDFIIGAWGYASSAGKAYIYFGAALPDTIPDLTFLGEASGDRFGGSVSSAGDVNGDGHPDAIVGAFYGGATDVGRAYLYQSSGGPLPIQLSSFVALPLTGHEVQLNWTTLSEVSNYGFEVQRRSQGQREFATLRGSFIAGAGTTNHPQVYSWTDVSAPAGHSFYRLKQTDLDGTVHFSEAIGLTLAVSAEEQKPEAIRLDQNYPNPFNPTTTIGYTVGGTRNHQPPPDINGGGGRAGASGLAGESGFREVRLAVYDLLGREVAVLVNERQAAGTYRVVFDASNMASGVYTYRLTDGDLVRTRKMTLLR